MMTTPGHRGSQRFSETRRRGPERCEFQRCATSAASGGPTCILANNGLSPVSATTGGSAPTYGELSSILICQPFDDADCNQDGRPQQRDVLRGGKCRRLSPRPIGRAPVTQRVGRQAERGSV